MKILKMLIVGVVLFGGSAAASWFLRPVAEATNETTTTDSSASSLANSQPDPFLASATPHQSSAGIPAETVLRLSESIKQKEAQLNQREKHLLERENRLKFMVDDLQRERTEMDTMLQQAEARTQTARDLLEQVQTQSTLIAPVAGDDANNDDGNGQISQPLNETQKENLENVAEFLSGLQADQAAQTIKQFCNDGKMEMVAQLLRFMEARDVSKLLDALNDPVLLSEILLRYRQLPPETEE